MRFNFLTVFGSILAHTQIAVCSQIGSEIWLSRHDCRNLVGKSLYGDAHTARANSQENENEWNIDSTRRAFARR